MDLPRAHSRITHQRFLNASSKLKLCMVIRKKVAFPIGTQCTRCRFFFAGRIFAYPTLTAGLSLILPIWYLLDILDIIWTCRREVKPARTTAAFDTKIRIANTSSLRQRLALKRRDSSDFGFPFFVVAGSLGGPEDPAPSLFRVWAGCQGWLSPRTATLA